MTLFCLHGFLGKPSDWTLFRWKSKAAVDLLDRQFTQPKEGLLSWARSFNRFVENSNYPPPYFLLGYSLGGRLAMHALTLQPTLWSKAAIVSAHPGLETVEQKTTRMFHDQRWSDRFLYDPWEPLMQDWNAQPVFRHSMSALPRRETEYSRKLLAEQLLGWSLGTQENLKTSLEQILTPILWIAGIHDVAYRERALAMTFAQKGSEVWIAPGSSHRVPWDIYEPFEYKIAQFLQ